MGLMCSCCADIVHGDPQVMAKCKASSADRNSDSGNSFLTSFPVLN